MILGNHRVLKTFKRSKDRRGHFLVGREDGWARRSYQSRKRPFLINGAHLQRVEIISSVRFTHKSLGIALRSPNTACFAKHARQALSAENSDKLCLIEPSLLVLDAMTQQIRAMRRLRWRCGPLHRFAAL